jgi:peptidoglycan-N-acetylglucosamine deacetylase
MNEQLVRPLIMTVNVEVESQDAAVAGGAGLFGRYSFGRYGAREGVWRLLNAMAEEKVQATFFVDGADADRHPHLVEAIMEGGHEIAQLGPPGIENVNNRAVLADRIGTDRERLSRVAGQPVTGWRAAQSLMSEETLPVLAELGFDYDSSFQDDDHPYLFQEGDTASLVELPSFRFLTDTTYFHARRTDASVRKAWREEFQAMHAEGSYIMLTAHSRGDFGCGRALRTRLVQDWLHMAVTTPGVEVLTCGSLATRTREICQSAEPFPRLDTFAQDMISAA